MSGNTLYITREGDRWDTVAYRAYGDALLFVDIVNANPTVPITNGILPGNLTLNIPVRDLPVEDENDLPPWKK